MSNSTHRPMARADAVVTELDDEALVYDFATHRAHCMNLVAYRVFQHCDGKRTLLGIAAAVTAAIGTEVSEAAVEQAVSELRAAGLLSAPARRRSVGLARRRVMKHMALTTGLAVAVPMVWSIVAPSV